MVLLLNDVGIYIIGAGLFCSIMWVLFVSLGVAVFSVVYPFWAMLRWALRRAGLIRTPDET